MTAQQIVVAGGTGFVGRKLVDALLAAGHRVRVMTRHPESYRGSGEPVFGDVAQPDSVAQAVARADAAYYLVHSLDSADFERKDAEAARCFSRCAAHAGLAQIIYLGGLGSDADDLSAHLRSRREVEHLLGADGVPVTVLRAGIVVGAGGLSWEMTRQLVDHLPGMITPRWVRTRTQPIALADVVAYLVGVLGHPEALGRTFDIGGPDVLEYGEMLQRVAAIQGRSLPIMPVPLLSPELSSRWLALVTDVDVQSGRNLIDSMVNEVVVTDDSIRHVVELTPMGYDEAVRLALAESGEEPGFLARLWSRLPMPLSHIGVPEGPETAQESARRKVVVTATALAGAASLGISLRTKPGSVGFYLATGATAAIWTAGSVASGRLRRGWIETRGSDRIRPVAVPLLTGVAAFGAFYGAALVCRRIPPLDAALRSILSFADEGDDRLVLLTALANGLGEELFFRGALYSAVGEHHPVLTSTALYTAATTTTRNPALVAAAAVMGTLFGLQRRASGGIQASTITHLTWSTLMMRYLTPLFTDSADTGCERESRRQ